MTLLNSFQNDISVVVIGGSGGIGEAITKQLIKQNSVSTIYCFSRSNVDFNHSKVIVDHIDLSKEETIQRARETIQGNIDIIINATGVLHSDIIQPEKSLRNLNMQMMQEVFLINTFGNALLLKHFTQLLPKNSKSVFASLSARVGSINDNQLGGWYSYRASKAALNMLIKTTSIEIARRYKQAAIIGLHPGTVETELSEPFRNNIHHDVFSTDQSARYLLNVINDVSNEDSGKVFAWNGEEIPY